jgi:ferric-dicitrate binding protein FerR (iron transport regulator)
MNNIFEHILLGSQVSETDLQLLRDSCLSDATLRRDVDLAVKVLEQIRESRIQEQRLDFEAAWENVFEKNHSAQPGVPLATRPAIRSKSRSERRTEPGAALRWIAVAAIVVSLSLFAYVGRQSIRPQEIVFHSDGDQFRVISMEDGSSVRLSPGSKLSISVAGSKSLPGEGVSMELDGSAFFFIAPRTEPLFVQTELSLTSVLGTRFGIVENEQTSQIFLLDGSVSFASSFDKTVSVIVGQNESSRIVGSDPPTFPSPIDVAKALEWTDLVLFRRTPLHEVASSLSARFGVQIEIEESLVDLTFTNTFVPEQGVLVMLETVALALGVHLDTDPSSNRYRFSPDP